MWRKVGNTLQSPVNEKSVRSRDLAHCTFSLFVGTQHILGYVELGLQRSFPASRPGVGAVRRPVGSGVGDDSPRVISLLLRKGRRGAPFFPFLIEERQPVTHAVLSIVQFVRGCKGSC